MKKLTLVLLFSYSLHGTNLINNGSVPMTITEPGLYLVTQDVSYTPAGNIPAITVNANNVIIDMLNFTVTQVNGLGFSVTGIQVQSLNNSIVIKNGGLNGFTQAAISTDSGCSVVLIDNINVNGCGNRGIECVGTSATSQALITISNCVLHSTCTVAGADNVITFSNINSGTITNCLLNLNGSTVQTSTFSGVKLSNCFSCLIKDIRVNRSTTSFIGRGFSIIDGNSNVFQGCIVNNLIASSGGSQASGFFFESSLSATNNLVQNCIATNITATSVVDGFFSGTNNDDNRFQFCQSSNLLARDVAATCHGFRAITNNRNQFFNCMALTCSSLSTVASPLFGTYGFRIDTTTGTQLRNCIADSNTAAVAGRGVGFFIFATSQCSMFQCTANRNTVGFDASNLTAGGAGTFNQQSFLQNTGQKNLTSQYNTNANAWPGAANDTVNNNAVNGLTVPWQNVGIT